MTSGPLQRQGRRAAQAKFAHSLGAIVTAAVQAGLRVDQLSEHLDSEFDPRGRMLTREDDGLFRMRIGGLPAPVRYTLVATRTSPQAP